MNTKSYLALLITALTLPWGSSTCADTVLDFKRVRLGESGTVARDDKVAVTFTAGKRGPATTSQTIPFTVTSDFDGDGTDDSFTFDLKITSIAPAADSTAKPGKIKTNPKGFSGVGNPRLDPGEAVQYSVTFAESSITLSGGTSATVSLSGFTGGAFHNNSFDKSITLPDKNFTANGTDFDDKTFKLAKPEQTLKLESFDDSIFVDGIDFQMSVTPATEAPTTEAPTVP